MYMNSSTKKALLIVAIALGIIALVWYLGLYNYFTLTSVQSNRAYLEQLLHKIIGKRLPFLLASISQSLRLQYREFHH